MSVAPVILGVRNDTGTPGDGITADTAPILHGTAAPLDMVELMLGPVRIGITVADANGHWETLANVIGEASASIVARTTGGDSAAFRLVVDQTAPALPLLTGYAGDTTGDRSQPIWQTADTTPGIAGIAEPGTIIRAYDGTTLLASTVAALNGAWMLDLGTRSLGQFYAIGIESEDGAGNVSTRAMLNLRVGETTIPVITAVQGPGPGNYPNGTALDFTVQFNKPMVIGIPSGGVGPVLEVLAGDQILYATYQSSPALHRLTFRLVLPPGVSDQDGIALGRLLANGGTLTDTSNNAVAGGLAGVPDLSAVLVAADLTPPALSGIIAPAAGNYLAGSTLVFTLAFSEAVQLLEDGGAGPVLEVLIGGTTWLATYQGQPAANRLAFALVVQADTVGQAGIALGRLLANGASVTDAAGNAWNAALGTLPNLSAVLVQADLTPPSVTAIGLEHPGPVGIGGSIIVVMHFSEAVMVAPGGTQPILRLSIDGTEVSAALLPGTDPAVLRFGLLVPQGMVATGIAILGLSDPAGAITDLVGAARASGLPAPTGLAALVVDGVAPVAGLVTPTPGRFSPGEVIRLSLATTEAVHLADGLEMPGLVLDIDGMPRTAIYDPAHSTPTSLSFSLVVQTGDLARGGIGILGLDDPESRLQDQAGNHLAFMPPAGLLGIGVWPADRTDPSIQAVEGPGPGAPLDFTLTFSEAVTTDPDAPPSLTVLVDGHAMVASFAGAPTSSTLAFHLDLPDGTPAPGSIELGSLAGGEVVDEVGNAWPGTDAAGAGWHYRLTQDGFVAGGPGDDTYYVDGQADVVGENAGEGNDGIVSTGSTYLFANIESLTLAGSAMFGVGNELANRLVGNAAGNLLIGMAGGDTMLGMAGDDTLHGEAGDDKLVGGAGNDYLIAGDGNDALSGGDDTDVLYGEAGNDNMDGGAALDYLFGGTGDDTLNGGSGPDQLYGEAGDDSLTGGPDFVFDLLVGGDGRDTLDGASGFGDFDYLYGGAGDDTFRVDTPADLVFEFASEGYDTVFADIIGSGYYLYAEIEALVLLGTTPFGVGNALDNVLTGSGTTNWLLGGAGDDTIDGKGGDDVLFGEAGADSFVFEAGGGADIIGDFTPGIDHIRFSGFTSFAQVLAATTDYGGTAFIDLGQGDSVTLQGVAKTALGAGDFFFG
ncbi:MAG: hypothetical protein JWP04_2061 [Belnapia sp.]|nr:hypothetical protein [Belnapia sp.]